MNTEPLSLELMNLQSNVIGLFKPRYSQTNEMVISNQDGYLTTITIGNLGGLHTNHTDSSNGVLLMFDEGETLYSLLSNPFKLDGYVKLISHIQKP